MMLCIVRVAVRLLLAREADLASASPSTGAVTSNGGPLGMVDVMIDEYRSDGQVPTHPRNIFFQHIYVCT